MVMALDGSMSDHEQRAIPIRPQHPRVRVKVKFGGRAFCESGKVEGRSRIVGHGGERFSV